ncbi:flavin reductase family protein [Micromonospora sp. NPDC051296]|uniref:flavin reductase family protein n=1 Tax=Micromonospora sp. NPDC051296 TaxID=3155046 RepID=UPI0034349274
MADRSIVDCGGTDAERGRVMTQSPLPALDWVPAPEFRALMSRFPTGVAVITTEDDNGAPRGMTCSSVCSVSLSPPTLLVCLRQGSPTLDAVLRRYAFAVNFLHHRARPTAELFASGDSERFTRVRWRSGEYTAGPHLIDDAHTVADCRVSQTDLVGDHVVVYGEVFGISAGREQEFELPLMYGLRQYLFWSASA